jgi:tripartite-type tricarboxylate transporter receptor subunit TctC
MVALVITTMAAAGCGGEKKKEQYPSQNINGFIAWGAGGGTDQVSRTLTPGAEKVLGKTIVMANKPGATGVIATQNVADQKADGYTLLFNAENPQLYPILGLSKLTYDDFEPILIATQGSTVIVVPKDSPYKTYADLINDAKANPGKINIGISGVGGQPYVTAAILKKVEGVSFNQVSYDGDGPLTTSLLGNQLQVTGLAVGAAVQYIKNGDMRALAIMSNKANPSIPNVPPITEIDPKYNDVMKASGFFYGVFVKKGTPEPIIAKLREAFQTAYKDAKFQDYMQKNGLTPMGITGDEAKKFMKEWQSIISWLIYDAGGAKESPEKFGIPKPAK